MNPPNVRTDFFLGACGMNSGKHDDQEKKSGMSNGKFGSRSTLSSEKSKFRIGELVTEVGAEIMSVRSDSEVCTLWPSP